MVKTLPGAGCPIVFSPDGKSFATGEENNVVNLWDASTWREIRSMTVPSGFSDFGADRLNYSPDGRLLASISNGGDFRLWEVSSGRFLGGRRDDAAEGLLFGPDGRSIVTFGRYGGPIRLWQISPLRTLAESPSQGSVFEVSADLRCSAQASGPIVKLEGSKCGKRDLSGHSSSVSKLAFSSDGKMLASGGHDQLVKIWDVASGRELRTYSGHTTPVTGVRFSFDGEWAVSSDFRAIHVWEVASGRLIRSFDLHGDSGLLSFTPDRKWVIHASGNTYFFEIASGQRLGPVYPGAGFREPGGEVSSPDGAWSARGSTSLGLFHKVTRTQRDLTGYPATVRSLAVSPDGRWLALSSGSLFDSRDAGDRSVRVWDLGMGQLLHRVSPAGTSGLAFAPDGRSIAAGGTGKISFIDPVTGERRL
ncbi:MAG: WD40 repeat domain-containing protein, partial [Terriglobia bacterium]